METPPITIGGARDLLTLYLRFETYISCQNRREFSGLNYELSKSYNVRMLNSLPTYSPVGAVRVDPRVFVTLAHAGRGEGRVGLV